MRSAFWLVGPESAAAIASPTQTNPRPPQPVFLDNKGQVPSKGQVRLPIGRSSERLQRLAPIDKGVVQIFDFYCPAARLAVEIDGATHWDDAKRAKDAARDAWLANQGIDVLRIGTAAVYRDLSAIADGIILRALERIAGG